MTTQFTFHTASVHRAEKALNALTAILKKGEQAPNAASLPTARIHEDMLPLAMQIFIACAHVRKLVSRATDTDVPRPDTPIESFSDMFACIDATLGVLGTARPDVVNGHTDRPTEFETSPGKTISISIADLAESYHLPNMFFHVVTAYNILRKEGVPLGKADYENSFMAPFLG